MKNSIIRNLTQGLHVYINIDNFESLLKKEETSQHSIKHSLKLLNSFFVAIRRYVNHKWNFPGLHVEKVTGSRMHLYIEIGKNSNCTKEWCAQELLLLAAYSRKAIDYLNTDIAKLNKNDDATISIGADYGKFRAFEFYDEKDGIDEETSIGFSANYACKLQTIVKGISRLAVSKEVMGLMSEDAKCHFTQEKSASLIKYSSDENGVYYSALLRILSTEIKVSFNPDEIREITNKINFSEMTFSRVKKRFNVKSLTEKDSKVFEGIALFSDIRGFTSQFKDDDSNLKEKSAQAIRGISLMIRNVLEYDGNHIQVQGDKEVAVFPLEYEPENGESIRDAVNCALSIVDEMRTAKLNVGIGMSYGDVYASIVDIRGSKSNVILGETVTLGNELEDKCAEPNELVISSDLYNKLSEYDESKYLCGYFKKRDHYYGTMKSFTDILTEEQNRRLNEETRNKNYYRVHYIENKKGL